MEIRKSNIKSTKKGFTIIELLIVVVTIALLFSFSVANYRDFANRRVLDNAVDQVVSDLRLAKESARAGRKPPGCGTTHLEHYGFNKDGDTGYYFYPYCSRISPCNPDSPSNFCTVRNLPTEVTIDITSPVKFIVLSRGTDGTPSTITLSFKGMSRSIEIQDGGNIQEL